MIIAGQKVIFTNSGDPDVYFGCLCCLWDREQSFEKAKTTGKRLSSFAKVHRKCPNTTAFIGQASVRELAMKEEAAETITTLAAL